MMHLARSAALPAVLAIALLVPARVRAEPPTTGGDAARQAEAIFREGRRLAVTGDYVAACARFAASQRLDPSTGTLLNLGDCEEHQGHWKAARERFREALLQLSPEDARVPRARERLAWLEERSPRLTITVATSTPPGSVVTLDGATVPADGIGAPVLVDPGEHEVALAVPGRGERRESVAIGERQARVIVLSPGEAAPPAKQASSTRPAHPPWLARSPSPGPPRALPWIAGGLALGGLALAGVSGVLLVHDRSVVADASHCNAARQCDPVGVDAAADGRTWLLVNATAWIVAGVGAAGGAVLLLSSRGGAPAAAVGLVPADGAVAVGLRARF